MIEWFSRKRMVIAIAFLIGVSVIVVIIENHWTPGDNHHHSADRIADNLTKDCWLTEEFTVLEECQPCSAIEIQAKSRPCDVANYREKLRCAKTGIIKRKCDRVVWIEERQFILFEVIMILLGCLSGSFTFYRQRILDTRVYQRIQRQVAAGV